ncbi:MAG: carbohydrate ABC transporter permease [Planctomycetes bacterium]|nr:carbohydrate ABC transporter permease [Planctomycetota bacterium]
MSTTDINENKTGPVVLSDMAAEHERLKKAAEMSNFIKSAFLHLIIVSISITFALPFLWMVLTSLKDISEVGLESWLPSAFSNEKLSFWEAMKEIKWSNYSEVFEKIDFGLFYWNSVFVAAWVTFLQVFTSSLAAFSFARLQWRGRDKVFLLYLATMMLPGLITMIPKYKIMIELGLVDSYAGLIIPASFSAFGTFMLRQFMLTIPTSLDEAAEIDGASKWQVYWNLILPLSRPGLITLTIFTFLGAYRNFFWPLVMLKSTHKYTLPIGLLYFDSSQGQETNLLMAAVAMSVVPMIVLFVVLQKYLVKGIQLGAVKG